MRLLAACAVLLLALPAAVGAQMKPDLPWRTMRSEHFRVHFTEELEPLARRTLANAEWAYGQLAAELPPPRGIVDIILADNIDAANGIATPFPSNRIVIYARPPVDELQLRNHADWNEILVVHELAHIFHLDRARGWWGLAQAVFGRAAPLFPNTYAPNWLIEGLAVHYETRLTGGGRLGGAEFPAQLEALTLDNALPPLDGLTSTSPFYPGGNAPYLLGAYLVQRALRHDPSLGEAESAARLLERSSRRFNPWRHDASAREAVGASFSELYRTFTDSLRQHLRAPESLPADSRSTAWWMATPRFSPDGELLYVANNQRQMPGLYRLDDEGNPRRVGRRNSVDANSPLDARRSLYAELDRTDPYSVRSDLYLGSGRWRRRFTKEERLAHPDVDPASGRIVAVRTRPGTTELVLLRDGFDLPRTIGAGSLDRNWGEPRWSRDGTRIAAALWEFGGRMSIVVIDTTGRELQRFSPRATDRPSRYAVVSAPAWFPGDTLLTFVSDHEGRPQLYVGDLRSGAFAPLLRTATAVRAPDVSPDGSRLAFAQLSGGGWQVQRVRVPSLPSFTDRAAATPAEGAANEARPRSPRTDGDAVVERYSPFASARPTWWLPVLSESDEGILRFGLLSSGRDVVGRHAWTLSVQTDLTRNEIVGFGVYSYAGFGNPVFTAGMNQDWVHGLIGNAAGQVVGVLAERTQTFSGTLLFQRPRARLTTYAIVGGEFTNVMYRAFPSFLLIALRDPSLLEMAWEPTALLSVGLSSMQRPGLSVSVEDGVALQLTGRYRGDAGRSKAEVPELIATANVAKSLPLPGFARHVVALRVAGGYSGDSTRTHFSVGGVSGSTLDLFPGLSVGDPQRTFFVRGLAPAALRGSRAAAASAEYRAPLTRVGRGVGLVPASVQKLSLVGFLDAGAAWCGAAVPDRICANGDTTPTWISTTGAELVFDTALQYDVLYRMRVGVARPVRGAAPPPRGATVFVSFGSSF